MQGSFCAPGSAAEVPTSRGIVGPINRLTVELRDIGVPVIWVLHANAHSGGKSDWELFFNYIVAEDVKNKKTLEEVLQPAIRRSGANSSLDRPIAQC